MKSEIYYFFVTRGISDRYIGLFVRFLLKKKAYEEFISDLTDLMHGKRYADYHTIQEWANWSSNNLTHNEEDIIHRFLIWNITPHEDLWANLNNSWRIEVRNFKKKNMSWLRKHPK